MATYTAIIPGNNIQSWLNSFAKATKKKTYKRIDYKLWRELSGLAATPKLRITCDGDKQTNKINKIYFSLPSIENSNIYAEEKLLLAIIPAQNEFGRYLENWLLGKEEQSFQIDWHKLLTDVNGKVIDAEKIQNILNNYDEKISSIVMSNDSPSVVTTTTGNIYQVSTPPYSNLIYDGNNWSNVAVSSTTDHLSDEIQRIKDSLADLQFVTNDSKSAIETMKKSLNNINKKENKEMNTNDMFNFDFGALNNSKIRMSMYGYAIPNSAGKYVSYDIEHNRMMDVQILNFNCSGLFYKMPKPLGKITVGDVVFHNGIPMFVREISEDRTRFVVIDPDEGTEKTILPAHSPFGFDYLTVLVSVMDDFDAPADADNPFGNMLPLLLLGNSNSADNLLPLMFMSGGKFDFDNPLMLLTMTGGNFDTSNPLVLMAMMKAFKNN